MNNNGKQRTQRGFRLFASSGKEAGRIEVQESSLAFNGAHVWIFGGRIINNDGTRGSLHVSVEQSQEIISGLRAFIREAEANELSEPAVEIAGARFGVGNSDDGIL